MKIDTIKSKVLNEEYYKINHSSRLTIYVYPKADYTSSYALFGTKYGSINTKFKTDKGDIITVPDGIAHYLEHKLFEGEEGDAFTLFSKTGASANAFTSFDRTMYLFSCADKFNENLDILLNFVQNPYFTEENVEKERGIIAQEIKMYEDSPEFRVLFNLLKSLYPNHPISVDIAGTVESINEITQEMLYTCYNNFYNLNNMVLVVVGNVNIDDVIDSANKNLKVANQMDVQSIVDDASSEIAEKYVEQTFPVMMPLFDLGFKENLNGRIIDEKSLAATDILLSMLLGESSELYRELSEKKLINNSFSFEHMECDNISCVLISGESRNPKLTAKIITDYISNKLKSGLSEDDFALSLKATYGDAIASFNNIEGIGNLVSSMHFTNREIYKYIECLSELTLYDVEKRFREQFSTDNYALSVIDKQS